MTQAAVPAQELVAWSVEVDDPGDLLSWLPDGEVFAFLRGRDGIVGARLSVTTQARSGEQIAAEVESLLAAMTVRDDVVAPGSGPVAIASLVFDPRDSGSVVVVPKVVLGRRDGRSWLTLVTPPGAAACRSRLAREKGCATNVTPAGNAASPPV